MRPLALMYRTLTSIKALLILAFVIYISGASWHAVNYFKESLNNEKVRSFSLSLNEQLRLKAGSVVASNNIDSLVYRTLLKIELSLPNGNVTGYKFDAENGLDVKINQPEAIVKVSDIIKYAQTTEAQGWVNVGLY